MKQVMMVKFDSPKWRKVDEYKVANPFVDVGFRQIKDVVDLRVFDLLNICSSSDGSETAISITLFLEMLYREMPCANKMIFSLADSERSIYAR